MKRRLKVMYLIAFAVAISSISGYQTAYTAGQPAVTDLTTTQSENVVQRITRLENILAHQQELISQLSALHAQTQELQGQLEIITNENTQLKQQQLKFYADTDLRLQNLEKIVISTKPSYMAEPAKNSVTKPLGEADAYQLALRTVKHKEYLQAVKLLKGFLQAYPASDYVPNVHYWLGEVYLIKAQPLLAKTQFTVLITAFPQHAKVPDALLKLAFIDYDQNNKIKALAQLKDIKKHYPGTKAAEFAEAKLAAIKNK